MPKLYIVATPIGNLGDITLRALTVLKQVAMIAAEDTRQSKKLLLHYAINTPLLSVHAHNEIEQSQKILNLLREGKDVAYITDAGTPLISDPGAQLVSIVRAQGFEVSPVPGACAAIAALSVAGLNSPHFYFEGFLPNKSSARRNRLTLLSEIESTLIFYESPHRIVAAVADMLTIYGNRRAVLTRELTKKFETVMDATLAEIHALLLQDDNQQLGEFVVLVAGCSSVKTVDKEKAIKILRLLMEQMPLKKAVTVASVLVEVPKNELYQLALALKKHD